MSIRDLLPLGRGKREMLPRHNGPSPLGALQLDINRAFADFWRAFDLPGSGASSPVPKVDVRESDSEVEVTADGRPVCWLGPQEQIEVRFEHDQVLIAQAPGATFYHRLREKFGRLAY